MLLQLPSSSRVPALYPSTPEGASSGAELVTSDGRSLALVSATLRGEAQGGLARLVLEQRFENTYDETLRVTYRMPLPADGAVSGYAFDIAGRTIKGVVDRKRQARDRFERAVADGKTAALLEQERADIFTQQIGNLPAREALVARITIDQRLVWLPEGEWELRFPTVIGPRYIGSADTAADVRATHIKVTDQPLTARIQISLVIGDAITGGGKPSSPTHALRKRDDDAIELHSAARLDRDLVMRWPVATPTVGLSLTAARPSEGADAYGLVTIVPPARDAKVAAVPRDLIVLIDTSGSMGGGPLDKAKQVIAMMLDSLDEQDRFELIEFSNEPRRYKQEPVMASGRAKQEAIKWVRSREADGATEMRAAVIEALQTLRVGAQRQVVLVTDGYVGGERQILEAMNRRLPRSCRLHVLGVGSAVNRSLATALSRAGRGAEVIVGIDEDAERGAKRLLDRTRMPMLTNVEISGSALLRHAPELIPDVFEAAPLVAALALRADGGELVVKGQLASGPWQQTITVPARAAGEGNQAIIALYGRERVADVEANALFGTVDGEVEELGLQFQIATRMTSWVAVDETRIVTGPTRDQLIPQELPYGTTASAFGLRGGMTMQGMLAGMGGAGAAAPSAMPAFSPPAQYSTRAGTLPSYKVDKSISADDLDFGEEAPAEIFGDAEGPEGLEDVGSLADDDADALFDMPTGQSAAAAPARDELKKESYTVRSIPLEPEAPQAPKPVVTEARRSSVPLGAPAPTASAPTMRAPSAPGPRAPEDKPSVSYLADEPLASSLEAKVSAPPAVGKVTTIKGYAPPQAMQPRAADRSSLAAPITPAPRPAAARPRLWLFAVWIAIVIALLLWWLIG